MDAEPSGVPAAEAPGAEAPAAGALAVRARNLHLASRMLPAFGLGVMTTFLVFRWGWSVSTPLQRAVFALGALAVVVGLVLDGWHARTSDAPT